MGSSRLPAKHFGQPACLWQKYQRFYRTGSRCLVKVATLPSPLQFPHGEFARASRFARCDETKRKQRGEKGDKQRSGFNFLALVVQISLWQAEFQRISFPFPRVSTHSSKLFVSFLRSAVHRYRLPRVSGSDALDFLFQFTDDGVFFSGRESTSMYKPPFIFPKVSHTFASSDELLVLRELPIFEDF